MTLILWFRIVWNGNNYGENGTAGSTAEYNAITPAAKWMVVNDTECVSNPSCLGGRGRVFTPTSGYTEDALGGSDIRFHGPFERRMLLGNNNGSTNAAQRTARRVHMMRYLIVSEVSTVHMSDGEDDYKSYVPYHHITCPYS